MRCETCRGKGGRWVPRTAWSLPGAPWVLVWEPCRECGGTKISHCCEGERPDLCPEKEER